MNAGEPLAPYEVPVFIIIGQSNADGSAYFDPEEDARMKEWYESDANKGNMKIWYRSSQVKNTYNDLGEAARHVIDGTVTDVAPGWLDLWYRNENTSGRTAMNMIHSYGTYSTGTDTNCAQGRRGMEGEFGKRWGEKLPDTELYVIKLGASGSFISAWADERDDTNWNYFYNNVYRPAVESLLEQGKKPRLAGIWWMQGCADRMRDEIYYRQHLETILERVNSQLGFSNPSMYVGHIVKPGENPAYPKCSVQFGQGVRSAQDSFASAHPGNVTIVDTSSFGFQDDNLHFDHKSQSGIGDLLADYVFIKGDTEWDVFSTPGEWTVSAGSDVFVPALGNPKISYKKDKRKKTLTAVLDYGTFVDFVSKPLSSRR